MISKICFKCGIEKPLDEYYKHSQMPDGHLNKCKECAKKDSVVNYNKKVQNVEFVLSERKRTREKFHRLKYGNKYNVSNDSKQRALERYFEKFPDHKNAKNKTSNAIRDGKLIKQPCSVCGANKVQAHHEDYSKPLDVNWLCVKHHNERHIQIREANLSL